MTNTITVTGIVISMMPIGDYDRRITILTKEKGKISAFAKGARKPTSALLSCSQPFSFGKFELFPGRSSYTVTSADISNYFTELRSDLDKIYYGMYFCELADFFTRENNDATETLKLLYKSLQALSNEHIGERLVRRIFELKLIAVEGEGPNMMDCAYCGGEKVKAYNFREDAAICEECYEAMKQKTAIELADIVELDGSTVYTIAYIVATQPEKLYNFKVTDKVLSELERFAELYKKKHIGQNMNAEIMLESIMKL